MCVYVFDRFSIVCCFMFLIDSVLLPLLDAYCECRNGFVRFFPFIIDIISLVFVLLFQFPYVLTRFTLCNVAIYSMYNYLSLLTVPRSFCFCFILLLIRFLLTLSPFNCLQNKVFLL